MPHYFHSGKWKKYIVNTCLIPHTPHHKIAHDIFLSERGETNNDNATEMMMMMKGFILPAPKTRRHHILMYKNTIAIMIIIMMMMWCMHAHIFYQAPGETKKCVKTFKREKWLSVRNRQESLGGDDTDDERKAKASWCRRVIYKLYDDEERESL